MFFLAILSSEYIFFLFAVFYVLLPRQLALSVWSTVVHSSRFASTEAPFCHLSGTNDNIPSAWNSSAGAAEAIFQRVHQFDETPGKFLPPPATTGNYRNWKLQPGKATDWATPLSSLGSRDPCSHCAFSSAGVRAVPVARCDGSDELMGGASSCPHSCLKPCLPFLFFPHI